MRPISKKSWLGLGRAILAGSILIILIGCGAGTYVPDPGSVKQVMRYDGAGLLLACRADDCPGRWLSTFGLRPVDQAAVTGIGWWPPGVTIQAVDLDAPVFVRKVRGPAQTAGVMLGDRIIEIGGIPITSIRDMAALAPAVADRTYSIKVVRGEAEMTFQITAAPMLTVYSLDELKVAADRFDEAKVFRSLAKLDNRVDPISKGPLYFFDLNVCNNLGAAEGRRVLEEQGRRAAVGSLVGAALGAGLGYSTGRAVGLGNSASGGIAAAGASSGAAAGGITGAASVVNQVDTLLYNCMINRGYKMLY